MRLAVDELVAPFVRHAGDVAADVVGIIVVVERGHGAVDTTLSLLRILVLGAVTHTPGVEHAATTSREGNLPEAFATGGHVVLTEFQEVILEGTQLAGAVGNDFFALLAGNLVHLLRSQVGILRKAIAVATKTVATGIESQTCTEALDEVLVDALGRLGNLVLVSPVAVVLGLLEVGEQLLVDNVAVGARQVEVIRVVGLKASGHVAPGLDEVVVDDGT